MISPRGLERVRPHLLYGTLIALLLASYLVHHATLGLRFPPPWPDEGSFLWQAVAFQEHSTLFAPELNPERVVMWMPPGYMVVQGLIFKLTGFSLPWARTLSALYLCGAIACLAVLLGRLRMRFAHLVLLGVFLHSPALLLAGNVARMETLVLLAGLGGVLLVSRGVIYPGMAILSLEPLLHPNGVFFALAGVLAAIPVLRRDPHRIRPTRTGIVALSLAACGWAAYGLHVAQNWQFFLHDMKFQLSAKGRLDAWLGGPWRRLLTPIQMVPDLVLLGAVLYARKFRLALQPLIALAVPLQVLSCLALGWLYDLYIAIGALVISVLAVEVVADALSRFPRLGRLVPRLTAAALTVAIAALDAHALAHDPTLTGTLSTVKVPLGVHEGPAYFTAEDRRALADFLRGLQSSSRPLTVQFFPEADALLVRELETSRVRFLHPTMYSMTSDVYVVHQSRRIPQHVAESIGLSVVWRDLVPISFERWRVIQQREGAERWLVYQRPRRAPPMARPPR